MSGKRRHDWNRGGHPRLALVTRILSGFLACVAVVLWVECLFLAVTRDWTLALAPLIPTAAAVLMRVAMWHVYGARPDYSAIAAMEREIYGETFEHEGAPKTVPPVAALFKPGLMHEGAGAFETLAGLRRGRKDYLRISGFRTECPEGHGEQLWVQGHGRMCPKCDEHRSNLRWERPT